MQKRSKYLVILMLACSALGRAQREIYVEPLRTVNAFVGPIRVGSSSNASGLIAVASMDKSIKVYDARTLAEQAAFVSLDQPCSALAFGREAKVMLSASVSGQVRLWDLDSKRKVKDLVPHAAGIVALAVLPQGLILTVGIDQSMKITDPVSGGQLYRHRARRRRSPEWHFTLPERPQCSRRRLGGSTFLNYPNLAKWRNMILRSESQHWL